MEISSVINLTSSSRLESNELVSFTRSKIRGAEIAVT